MAQQDVFHAVRVDQPRDLYIKGELVTAQAGTYMLTDADGNLKIVGQTDFSTLYADAGNGVAGDVIEVKPNTRKAHKNATQHELKLEAPADDTVDPKKQEDLNQQPEVKPASKEETEELLNSDQAVTRVDAELSPEVPDSKKLSDKKTLVGEPSLKSNDPAFPPTPTKPAKSRHPRPEGEKPLSETNVETGGKENG
jgi:hypothetical protein